LNGLLLLSRLAISVVFVVAGAAKLADLPGSRRAVRDFGVPPKLADALGTALPFAELAVGIALLPNRTAWWGAVGAMVILLVFLVGISLNLAQGRQPDCHCFGQLHSAPVSWKTLVGDGGLALLAAFVVWQGRDDPGSFDGLYAMTSTEILLLTIAVIALIIAVIEGWFLRRVLQEQKQILMRLEVLERRVAPSHAPHRERPDDGLPVGTPAPTFQLPDLEGKIHTLDSLRPRRKPMVLLFSDPACRTCAELLPDVAFWQEEYASELMIVVISRGAPEANQVEIEDYALQNVLLQSDREVSRAYGCQGTPAAVLIRADGMIGSPLAIGADEIEALVEETIGDL
jgi:uncharacterized membrane protein YphA (DoxX/SURF4 family)/peroxiredoxin